MNIARGKLIGVAALALAAVLAGSFLVFGGGGGTGAPKLSSEQLELLDGNVKRGMTGCRNGDLPCQVEVLQTNASIFGAIATVDSYFKLTATNEGLRAICHTVTHDFGEWAWENYGEDAFSPQLHSCLFGYIHGFFVGMAKSMPSNQYAQQAVQHCDQVSEPQWFTLCVHGVGHGASEALSSMGDALAVCEVYTDTNNQMTCIMGAAMEWESVRLTGDVSFENLTKLCESLKGDLLRECLGQVLQYHAIDPSQLDALVAHCATLTDEFYDGCEKALGYSVLNDNLNIYGTALPVAEKQAKQYCGQDRGDWCISTLIGRVLTTSGDLDASSRICAALPAEMQSSCLIAVKVQASVVPDNDKGSEFGSK